jgi:hypothetical protein
MQTNGSNGQRSGNLDAMIENLGPPPPIKKSKAGKKSRATEEPDVAALAAPPAAKGAVVFIPKIETIQTTVEVRGISPLIVHAWGKKAKEMMRAKQQKLATRAREAKDPEQDFNESRYINEKGEDCLPVIAFKSCAVEAGVIAGVHKTTLRKAFFVGHPGQDLVPILDGNGKPYSDKGSKPTMREDMVRVGMGVADMRYRAEYRDWSVKIPVEFNPRIISMEQLCNLFDNAGYSVGICEWRPEKDGQFGRFRLVIG